MFEQNARSKQILLSEKKRIESKKCFLFLGWGQKLASSTPAIEACRERVALTFVPDRVGIRTRIWSKGWGFWNVTKNFCPNNKTQTMI